MANLFTVIKTGNAPDEFYDISIGSEATIFGSSVFLKEFYFSKYPKNVLDYTDFTYTNCAVDGNNLNYTGSSPKVTWSPNSTLYPVSSGYHVMANLAIDVTPNLPYTEKYYKGVIVIPQRYVAKPTAATPAAGGWQTNLQVLLLDYYTVEYETYSPYACAAQLAWNYFSNVGNNYSTGNF